MTKRYVRISIGILAIFTSCITSGLADAWDPGDDDYAGATVLSAPSTTLQTNGIHSLTNGVDDADWFKVSLTAGTTYLFDGFSEGSDDTYAELFADPLGSPLAENDDYNEVGNFHFLIVYTPVSSGDYYLKVTRSIFADDGLIYTLRYNIPVDAWDPADDTGAGAILRPFDEFVHNEGLHSLVETDANDWYKFSLNAGNTYRLKSVGKWNIFSFMYSDIAGTTLVDSDDNSGENNNFKLDFTPGSSGDYYLKVVQTNNPLQYANYDLAYMLIEDEWDPADDFGAGGTVLSDIDDTVRIHGPHALSSTDTNDWFEFPLVEGNTYRFESTGGVSGGSDPAAILFSDAAGTMGITTNFGVEGNNFEIIFTATTTANYYLNVSSFFIGNDSIYNLQYSKIEGDLDNDGMPDTWEIEYFGSTNALPEAHGDADLFSNMDEFIAGTDPTNSASYFSVNSTVAGNFIVEWSSVAGREYEVIWVEHLTNSFQSLESGIEHPQSSYTDTVHTTETEGFYKVKVKLQ
ncbi:MAG: PPC domain-containing protein [Pontiella sp.]